MSKIGKRKQVENLKELVTETITTLEETNEELENLIKLIFSIKETQDVFILYVDDDKTDDRVYQFTIGNKEDPEVDNIVKMYFKFKKTTPIEVVSNKILLQIISSTIKEQVENKIESK